MRSDDEILALMDSCDLMARMFASRFAIVEHRSVQDSEAYADARYHLFRAAASFVEGRDTQFQTYAYWVISRGVLRDYRSRRGMTRSGKNPAVTTQITYDQEEMLYRDNIAEMMDQEEMDVLWDKFEQAMVHMDYRTGEMLRRRFSGEQFKEIGEVFGVSKQRAEQITSRAIQKFKESVKVA